MHIERISRRKLLASAAVFLPGAMLSGCAKAAQTKQPNSANRTIYSSSYSSLKQAMQAWAATAGTLVIDRDYLVPENIYIAFQTNKPYHLTTLGARVVTYTGPHYHWLIRILSQGSHPFSFAGDLTLDGKNNVNIPFWAQFDFVEGAARRDCVFTGRFVCKNARMKRGKNVIDGASNSTYDAICMRFSGGFNTLSLQGVQALSAGRDAGIAAAGTRGCRGIEITGALETTNSPRHVHVSDFVVADIGGDDPPGSIAAAECDGLLIFKAAEIGAPEPIIERGVFRECLGRGLKLYSPAGGGLARDLKVQRSKTIAGAIDINFQHGDGLVTDVEIEYRGAAHGVSKTPLPTVPISLATSHMRKKVFPFREAIVRNIRISDTTGVAKQQIIGLSYGHNDTTPRAINLENIYDSGSAVVLFRPAAMGRYQNVSLTIKNVDVALSLAVCETDDPMDNLRVAAENFVNRGKADLPVVALLDGRQRTVSWGRWESKGTLKGFKRIDRLRKSGLARSNGFEN